MHTGRPDERPRPSCPFTETRAESEGRGAATGVADMFDFSALMEFINSLGLSMAAGQREPNIETQERASTSQSAAAGQATTSQSTAAGQASTSQSTAAGQATTSRSAAAGQATTSQPSTSQQSARQRPGLATAPEANPTDFLSNLGQAITEFLDPFGESP